MDILARDPRRFGCSVIGAENVVMTDIDEMAVVLAKENAALNGVGEIKVVQGDAYENVMGPKIKFTKEQINDAAFEIAQTEGIDSITMRKIAKKMGSYVLPFM